MQRKKVRLAGARRSGQARPRRHTERISRLCSADRSSLLLGTALASTLLIGAVIAPAPALAVDCTQPPSPQPIDETAATTPITCVNTVNRTGTEFSIGIITQNPGSFIDLFNSGVLTPTNNAGTANGIQARTTDSTSPIDITNVNTIVAKGSSFAIGIFVLSDFEDSAVTLKNSGNLTAVAGTQDADGIRVLTFGANSFISITNSGDLRSTAGDVAHGIYARTNDENAPVNIFNSGNIWSNGRYAWGVEARADGSDSAVSIFNTGDATITSFGFSIGLLGRTDGLINSPVTIFNSGNLNVTSTNYAWGIFGETRGDDSPMLITNVGDVLARGISVDTQSGALVGDSFGLNSPVTIINHGSATGLFQAHGIFGRTVEPNSPLTIINTGDVLTVGTGAAIYTRTDQGAPTLIFNSGSVFGDPVGIKSASSGPTTIINTGFISAQSLLAIQSEGPGGADIFNTGTITGFVLLDADDNFFNQAGGTFEARLTSDFDKTGAGGNDLFVNQTAATVHTAGAKNVAETTRFINLERFNNRGLISTVDFGTGDRFILSNTPGGTDHDFVASGNSTVALDVFLGGPTSPKDLFIIQGNVTGQTAVEIVNTNPGGGVYNTQGIPIIFVDGATPSPGAFYMTQPVDAGFFDYDLFFVPTGSGYWELRSLLGGGAYLLPQLVTAAQDIWHEGSSTWFDRTADLRVLLNGGAAPSVYGDKDLGEASYSLTPAVWARGSGSWLERDDSAGTTAYGRNYRYDLERDLTTVDFQVGLDLGHRDLFSPGDILVFGMLGGFVHGNLDYDNLAREFEFDGGQIGAYATYLKGGLFVDTLLNAHLYELDTATRGFPDTLDASTIGLRTDGGYRFGSFSGGPFLEPLATIEVLWADIDGFSMGGNTVSFDDDPDVRGRLGLRAGTTMQVWEGTTMEPFVIGSLWGNFTDGNQATLVSNGTTFRFQDDLEDVWGEVSGGLNFFNPAAGTAVFAKVDVTFGDDVTGVGGKAGMRVAW